MIARPSAVGISLPWSDYSFHLQRCPRLQQHIDNFPHQIILFIFSSTLTIFLIRIFWPSHIFSSSSAHWQFKTIFLKIMKRRQNYFPSKLLKKQIEKYKKFYPDANQDTASSKNVKGESPKVIKILFWFEVFFADRDDPDGKPTRQAALYSSSQFSSSGPRWVFSLTNIVGSSCSAEFRKSLVSRILFGKKLCGSDIRPSFIFHLSYKDNMKKIWR